MKLKVWEIFLLWLFLYKNATLELITWLKLAMKSKYRFDEKYKFSWIYESNYSEVILEHVKFAFIEVASICMSKGHNEFLNSISFQIVDLFKFFGNYFQFFKNSSCFHTLPRLFYFKKNKVGAQFDSRKSTFWWSVFEWFLSRVFYKSSIY